MQAVSYYRFPTISRFPTPPPSYPQLPTGVSHRHLLPLSSASSTGLAAATTTPLQAVVKDDDTDELTDSATAAFWDYQFLFVSQRAEQAEPVALRLVEGSFPPDFPLGTYYLTGPGLFTDDQGSTVHPLDGHGYLRAFEFAPDGVVRYSARYVATEAAREEREAGTGAWRFTHRGPFSVLRAGPRVGNVKVMKNVANTCVLRWGGRLLCLWEGGDPYELDPESLDTIGPLDMIVRHGDRTAAMQPRERRTLAELGIDLASYLLKPILYGVFRMPPKRLLAHYKIDAKRNRLLMLSCNAEDMLLPRSNFTFYEFDSNFELKQKKEVVIPEHLMIHDWAFTDNHYILFGNRIKLDVPGSLLAVSGLSPMISALSVNPSQPRTPIYLIPRFSECADGCKDWRVPIEAPSQLWVLHVGNAFEEWNRTGNLEIQMQVSACSYQWFNFQKVFGYNWQTGKLDPSSMNLADGKEALLPHLIQVSIEIDQKGICRRCSVNHLSDQWKKPADFPVTNPSFAGRKNCYVYAGTTSGSRRFLPHFPFDSVLKLNCSNKSVTFWRAGRRKFIGEPIFVAKGMEEDDGYILVIEYAVLRQRCYLVVLDARKMGADALVAKFEVPKHLNFPLGFHGFWENR